MSRIIQSKSTFGALNCNAHIAQEWGPRFNRGCGWSIELNKSNVASIFIDERVFSKDLGAVRSALDSDEPFAYIRSCEGREWRLMPELLDDCNFGFIAYTENGKAILCGEGTLSADAGVSFNVRTPYAGIRNGKKKSVSGKGTAKSDGSYEATIEFKIEF